MSSALRLVGTRDLLPALRPARPVRVQIPGVLRAGRLVLRPLHERDREAYCDAIAANREHLDRWIAFILPGETESQLFERQLELTRQTERRCTGWRRIALLDDGRIAGSFNLSGITRGLEFEATANWWIDHRLIGRGLAAEGLVAMLTQAFRDLPEGLGLHRVHAPIMPSNTPSIRLAERAGFHLHRTAAYTVQIGPAWKAHDHYMIDVLGFYGRGLHGSVGARGERSAGSVAEVSIPGSGSKAPSLETRS